MNFLNVMLLITLFSMFCFATLMRNAVGNFSMTILLNFDWQNSPIDYSARGFHAVPFLDQRTSVHPVLWKTQPKSWQVSLKEFVCLNCYTFWRFVHHKHITRSVFLSKSLTYSPVRLTWLSPVTWDRIILHRLWPYYSINYDCTGVTDS